MGPLPFNDAVRQAYDIIRTPIWAFDYKLLKVCYCNDAAVQLWQKESKQQFLETDYSKASADMITSLQSVVNRLSVESRFTDAWKFFPNELSRTVLCDLHLAKTPDDRTLLLAQAHYNFGVPSLTNESLQMIEIMRNLPVCVGLYMPNLGDLVFQNPTSARMFGDHNFFDLFYLESDANLAKEAIQQTFSYRSEIKVKTVDGIAWHAVQTSNIHDPVSSQELLLVYQVAVDSFNVVRDLRKAQQEAIAANEAKTRFLSTVSHEIRTPLHGILGFAELLEATPLTDEQASYVEMLRLSGRSLLSIINDILELSRIEAGMLEVSFSPFGLRDCLDEAVNIIFGAACDKKIQVSWAVEQSTLNDFYGDQKHLKQTLINLMGNGVKFTPRGGMVSVEVFQVDNSTIDVASSYFREKETPLPIQLLAHHLRTDLALSLDVLTQTAVSRAAVTIKNKSSGTFQAEDIQVKLLLFAVSDTGIGIPPETTLEQLCKPFTQLDSSNTRSYEGTGLGLAITKQLVESMGGVMFFTSTVGQGSMFCILIPAVAAPSNTRSLLINSRTLNSSLSLRDVNSPSRSIEENMPDRVRRLILTDEDKGIPINRRIASGSPDNERPTFETSGSVHSFSSENGAMSPLNPMTRIISTDSEDKVEKEIATSAVSETSIETVLSETVLSETVLSETTSPDGILLQPSSKQTPSATKESVTPVSDMFALYSSKQSITPPIETTLGQDRQFEAVMRRASRANDNNNSDHPCHVLVVEDNHVNRLLIGRILTMLNCHYTMAFNGQEAVDALKERGPAEYDVILMDVSMPVMDGLEATRVLLQMFPEKNGRPIIVGMTAYAMQDNKETCLNVGMDDFMSKPASIADIRNIVDKFKGRRFQVGAAIGLNE